MPILVEDIDDELKADYVELIREGYSPGEAATMLGSTGTQFRKLRNGGFWHDPAFADQVAAALGDDKRGANRRERLDNMVWRAAEAGEKWAIEKLLYAYHPDFEALRHTNLRVSGQIEHIARMVKELPHLTDDQIRQRIAAIEAEEAVDVRLLPPASEAA